MSATATQSLQDRYSLRAVREYRNYIDGEWVPSSKGKTFENRNPADTDDLVRLCYGSSDFREGVDAFVGRRSPVWKGS